MTNLFNELEQFCVFNRASLTINFRDRLDNRMYYLDCNYIYDIEIDGNTYFDQDKNIIFDSSHEKRNTYACIKYKESNINIWNITGFVERYKEYAINEVKTKIQEIQNG